MPINKTPVVLLADSGHERMRNDLEFREPKRNVNEDEAQTYSQAHDMTEDNKQVKTIKLEEQLA